MQLELDQEIRAAVRSFWASRSGQQKTQKARGTADQGTRGSVTGGKHLDGFLALFRDLLLRAEIPTPCATSFFVAECCGSGTTPALRYSCQRGQTQRRAVTSNLPPTSRSPHLLRRWLLTPRVFLESPSRRTQRAGPHTARRDLPGRVGDWPPCGRLSSPVEKWTETTV